MSTPEPVTARRPALRLAWAVQCLKCGLKPVQSTDDKKAEEDLPMRWTKPTFVNRRFGFEINLYINNR
jgi:coenzyme PQQ precursor peptide PqqA